MPVTNIETYDTCGICEGSGEVEVVGHGTMGCPRCMELEHRTALATEQRRNDHGPCRCPDDYCHYHGFEIWREQREQLAEARKALEFYANEDNYRMCRGNSVHSHPIQVDGGRLAIHALAQQKDKL
jgi:hypothetical protein